MQTFLPFDDFYLSLKLLDKRRLWKQCVEAHQIYSTITGQSDGWKNHPTVKMWRNYDDILVMYFNTALNIAINMHHIQVKKYTPLVIKKVIITSIDYPEWLGDYKFHHSHQCNLYRKALSDNEKNRPELLDNFKKMGIITETLDPTTQYFWPV